MSTPIDRTRLRQLVEFVQPVGVRWRGQELQSRAHWLKAIADGSDAELTEWFTQLEWRWYGMCSSGTAPQILTRGDEPDA